MNILLLGSGGRECAIATALVESPSCDELFIAPGNGGTAELGTNVDLDIEDGQVVVDFARENGCELVVIGPEAPLVAGVADAVRGAGIDCFGPGAAGARLEGSKDFSKSLMMKYDLPTAAYGTFTDCDSALAYLNEHGAPIVVKADGLAAGKGVTVALTKEAADEAICECFDGRFGEAGSTVVIEEMMTGPECSMLVFTDGVTVLPMAPSQDHKRAYENDEGPNTGGMGAYAPAPVMTPELVKEVEEKILRPVVDGLAQEGIVYQGCLYAGLMITADGPKVVEFNCRFGDPETQAVLPLLDGDLAEIMYACTQGTLTKDMVAWKDASACCVIMASAGYPASSHKGDVISGLDSLDDTAMVFHSGTAKKDGQYVTNGGRVLGVTAVASTLKESIDEAYRHVAAIHFDGQQVRSDIGAKGLKHLQ